MTKEDEEDYTNSNNCRFGEKEVLIDEVRDHCHLTHKHRGPAHKHSNFFATQTK